MGDTDWTMNDYVDVVNPENSGYGCHEFIFLIYNMKQDIMVKKTITRKI